MRVNKVATGKTKRGMSPGVVAWRQSEEWRRTASAYALANLRAFAQRPRCGAKAKRTGCPCRQPALANGRCRWHGGRTPKGANWHQAIFSPGTTPSGTSKLDRKLHDLAVARKRRLLLLAKMTPEQLDAHEKWHQARDPSLPVRLSRRQAKVQALHAQAILADAGQINPDIMRLEELIHTLEIEARSIAAQAAINSNEGIFG